MWTEYVAQSVALLSRMVFFIPYREIADFLVLSQWE